MKYLKQINEKEVPGACLLMYSKTGGGKTDSASTGPTPALFINKEPKDPRLVHSRNPEFVAACTYAEPEDFYDEIDFLSGLVKQYESGERPYEMVFHDGLTFSMAIYKQAIEDDRFKARELAKESRGIIDRARFERPDWGVMASLMARETYLLNRLSKFGILVVSTAIEAEFPKWNGNLSVGPSLLGQEFPKLIHGYFDFIGYVVTPFHIESSTAQDGAQVRKIVTPRISFVPPGDDSGTVYMARCNSARLTEMELKGGPPPLDLKKILRAIRGEKRSAPPQGD